MTAQGHPRAIFKRAIEHGNVMLAEMTARELGRLALERGAGIDDLAVAATAQLDCDPVALVIAAGQRGTVLEQCVVQVTRRFKAFGFSSDGSHVWFRAHVG